MKYKVGLIQMTSVLDPAVNLEKIKNFLADAKKQNLNAVFLPECFYSMSNGLEATPYLVEKDNEHYKNIQNLSIEFDMTILGGSAATLEYGKIFNRCYNFLAGGKALKTYDKAHLFKVDLKSKAVDESIIYTAGRMPHIQDFERLRIGLSICFDLRFPEMYRRYRSIGANVFSISSAFTVPTGKAHWHTLMKARAIENQCYVIAAAQWGEHNDKVKTYGHSLVVDPWGEILVDAQEGEKLITAEIDLDYLDEVRSRMDVAPVG